MGGTVLRTLELTNKLIDNPPTEKDDNFVTKAIRIYLMELRKTKKDMDVTSDNIDILSTQISNYLRDNTTLPEKYTGKNRIYEILKNMVE
jgi:antitoxin component HigA of HigAB toxin-antitoxin module